MILAGTAGSYVGSALSYWISLWIGRPLVLRYGRYFLLGEDKIARAEIWLQRYEAGGIFFARLLPVIRHLISIPAGLIRMNFAVFSAVTVAGAAIWCGVLAYLGDRLYHASTGPDPEARGVGAFGQAPVAGHHPGCPGACDPIFRHVTPVRQEIDWALTAVQSGTVFGA